ncbi:probable aminoacyl tRNA synthase complex-interacting multifunctional protein 2 isoform X1 [Temnothorax longispinosus]|uniref:probable aminoacyl tRNA synthase complex-interacting multifunctional protein 2 isoform X1 n=1 Tax=Temnothorax longispinosus TaxID=300112 RepID=UPI003A9A53A5
MMCEHATMATRTYGMYPVRPVVDLLNESVICGRFSMYKMRNIHEDGRQDRCPDVVATDVADAVDLATGAEMPDSIATQVIRLLQASRSEHGTLEARQEKVLDQLAELKKQIYRLQCVVKESYQKPKKDLVSVQKPIFVDLVLNVNPSKPPYSLLALQKLWKDTNFKVKAYTHSTTKGQIPIVFPETTNNIANIVDVTLIWKEVSNMEVVTKISHSCPIKGEVNFLRYVSRMIESHNYESTCSQPHTLDFALDFVNSLYNERRIEKGLLVLARDFEKWSCKGGFNIVDIAVWSLIKQFPGTSLPPTLREWYTLCETTFTET